MFFLQLGYATMPIVTKRFFDISVKVMPRLYFTASNTGRADSYCFEALLLEPPLVQSRVWALLRQPL